VTRNSPSSVSRRRSQPVRASTPPLRREVIAGAGTASARSAADHLAPLGAGIPPLSTRCSTAGGAGGLTGAGHQNRHVAYRETAKGGIEFWPAWRPRRKTRRPLPRSMVQKKARRPAGGPGRGQDRRLAEQPCPLARP
jgi:hypothetical protein